jgi:hypothetical protein
MSAIVKRFNTELLWNLVVLNICSLHIWQIQSQEWSAFSLYRFLLDFYADVATRLKFRCFRLVFSLGVVMRLYFIPLDGSEGQS